MGKQNQNFYWVIGFLGPIISTVLDKWFVQNPSEILLGVIYSFGFCFFILSLFFSYRIRIVDRKTDLLEKMIKSVTFSEDGKPKEERGYIDSNSVEAIKALKDI